MPRETTIDEEAKLQTILKHVDRARKDVPSNEPYGNVSAEDIALVVNAIGSSLHNLSHLVLSTIVFFLRESGQKQNQTNETVTHNISHLFVPIMDMGMRSADDQECGRALFLLVALMQIDPLSGVFLFLRDGMLEWLEELPELFPTFPLVQRQLAVLFSLASNQAACRSIVMANFLPWLELQARVSTDTQIRTSCAVALTKLARAEDAAGNDGIDLSGTSQEDMAERAKSKRSQTDELATLLRNTIVHAHEGDNNEILSPVIDSIEGLAYLSVEVALRESLSKDQKLLQCLFALLPVIRRGGNLVAQPIDDVPAAKKINTALVYGISVIISNIVAFPPRLTEEESQLAKLRKLANPVTSKPGGPLGMTTGMSSTVPEDQESDASVIERGKRLIKAGVLPALTALARAESVPTRHAVGRAYLSLVEPNENRGPILQNGGSKTLMSLIRGALSSVSSSSPGSMAHPASSQNLLAVDDLTLIQALAKLAITTSPRLLFGTSDSALIDAIRPFSLLLLHPRSSLLQRFEAMMALTNLASVSAVLANRVATVDLATKLDVLILDDHIMVRRAATELVCNLIHTDVMFARYGGKLSLDNKSMLSAQAKEPSATAPATPKTSTSAPLSTPPTAVISRVHVLLALSDVEDQPTRLAACGALAMLLSNSASACRALLSIEKGPSGVFTILGDILDPSRVRDEDSAEGSSPGIVQVSSPLAPVALPGDALQLAHRAVVCTWSILSNAPSIEMEEEVIEAANKEGLAAALVALVKPLTDNHNTIPQQPQTPSEIILSGVQCLKWLMERGAEVRP
ncbi:hypothetical protein BS47DRAFT_330566 [Hydnum rufescens UP504]|uniref:UNC-45/Cro1/She4 central domain-containing protein n=1 Tax=Hydnum rufescens UP504 TaxID=1448309 RepID=A0A9P6E0M1_9AGAM|nr:hypothetical protein BS47DRAFT_330566 [Hydnum rufescens UP504]